jgi:hypothetical protein
MKIVFNALSARLGGGQTYLINLFRFVPFDKDIEIRVFAPSSLKLPDHSRIRRVQPAWPTENSIVRALWGKWVLPGILKAEKADVLFCPGGVVGTRAPAGCKVATMLRSMIQFDLHVRKSLPLGLQRLRNWFLSRIVLKNMSEANLTIFVSNYARSIIESLAKAKNPFTIHHGIDSVFLLHGKSTVSPDLLLGKECALYVSRFDVYKHNFQVVSACGELAKELFERFSPFDSQDKGQVLTEVLTNSELLKMLAVAAVAQGDKFDWEDVSRKTWSELLALAKLHKVGV